MGCGASNQSTYDALKSSVIGKLIPDSDFAAFHSVCHVESSILSGNVPVTQGQLFYVVCSGEVAAVLSTPTSKPLDAVIFRQGDIIHLFKASFHLGKDRRRSSFSLTLSLSLNKSTKSFTGSNQNGVKLFFQYRRADTTLIGATRQQLEKFLSTRPHFKNLKALFDLDINSFASLPGYTDISKAQFDILGPLMKLKSIVPGEVVASKDGSFMPSFNSSNGTNSYSNNSNLLTTASNGATPKSYSKSAENSYQQRELNQGEYV